MGKRYSITKCQTEVGNYTALLQGRRANVPHPRQQAEYRAYLGWTQFYTTQVSNWWQRLTAAIEHDHKCEQYYAQFVERMDDDQRVRCYAKVTWQGITNKYMASLLDKRLRADIGRMWSESVASRDDYDAYDERKEAMFRGVY